MADGAEGAGVTEGSASAEGGDGAADSDSPQRLDSTSPGAQHTPTPPPSSPGTPPPGLRTSSESPGQLDAELVGPPVGDGTFAGHDVPPVAQPGATGRPTATRGAQTPGAPLTGEVTDPAVAPDAQDQEGRPGSEPQPPATDGTAPLPTGPVRISTTGGTLPNPTPDLDLDSSQDSGYESAGNLDNRTAQPAPTTPAPIPTTGGTLPNPTPDLDLDSDHDSGYESADDPDDLDDLDDVESLEDRAGVVGKSTDVGRALAEPELPAPPGVVATASTTAPDPTGGSTDTGATVSTAPVHPEQWRGRQAGAPSVALRTERYDPAADPLAQGPGRGKGTLGGRDTVIRVSIERVQADDGRWVRNLTLNLPVSFGEGFSADQLDDYQGSLRELLDTFVNGGPDPLPKSGDQLNLDLNFVHAPDHPEAIKLSRVDRPTDFDQFEFQLYAEDPALGPEENDRRRQVDAARALHELLHYAGLADRSFDPAFLFRRTRNAAVDSSGIMADPDTLPEPGLPAHYLRSIEDVTDSGPLVVDHPLTAPPVTTASKNPADLLAPVHLRPAHPPSQASIGLTTTSGTADEIEGLWDSAVDEQDGDADGILTLTVDGGSVTAGDLTPLILERIGAADRVDEITVPKPGTKLKAGAKHKVLLSYSADGRRGTLSREIRIESAQSAATASASAARPGPATTSGPVFEPGITPAANRRKLEVGRRIGAALDALIGDGERLGDVTGPAVLIGGAGTTVRFNSPRPLDGLEFRLATGDVRQYADVVNQALAEHFPSPSGSSPNVLRADPSNPGTLSGTIDGVEVTIGPDGGLHDDPTQVRGHTVPSVLDSVVDTAYALAVGTDQRQRASALFDLLWMLGAHPGLDAMLAEELVKRRGAQYAARPPAGGKNDLTAQFGQVLGGLMGSKAARAALSAQWRAFGATPQDTERLDGVVTDLADVFRAGPAPYRALILTAGNFTGDMFGVATALTLNPKLHLGVLTGPRHSDQLGPFIRRTLAAPVHARYARAVAELDADTTLSPAAHASRLSALAARRDADLRAQEERVHVLHTDEPHSLYTNTANGYEAIPYTEMSPPVPPGLRSIRLQKTTAYATSEVANLWGGRSQGRARMRTAWGLDSPDTDLRTDTRTDTRTDRMRSFLAARGVPEQGPYVVLWSRLSSRQEGEAHPQHDTGTEGMRQIIAGLPPATKVILAGDASRNGALRRLADSHDNVHDLTEFWNDDDWRQAFPDGTREDQLQFFDHLADIADGDLKHLGFRSGNLEAFALVGHQVRYLEESGNGQAKRMQTWHAPAIGYQRITLNQVPTLAGQWVVAKAAETGKETAVPWWSLLEGNDAEAKIRAQHKTAALAEFNIGNGRDWRGFTPLDLRAIRSYLDFAAKGTTPAVLASPPAAGETSAEGETSAPAKKMTPEVTAAFYRGYTDYLFSDQGARDFDSVYYAFLDEQGILDQNLARHQKLLPQMAKFHDELLAIEAEQAARPTVIPHTDREPMRLYRKMAESEAEVFLNAKDAKAGVADAMAYNRSDEYRKFFTTSLSHTHVFSNANAASDSEAVVEFTLPWNGYWDFVGSHGTPNQQDGAYRVRDSALVHQEQLRTGAAANFRSKEDVDAVIADLTHHNVGIGHGNRKQFAALITGMRVLPADEVTRAAQDAREAARLERVLLAHELVQQKLDLARQRASVHGEPFGDYLATLDEVTPVPPADWSDLVGLDLDPDAVPVVQAVRPPRPDALVAGLLALPAGELARTLELLDPAHRRWLATHAPFVDAAHTSLSTPEFAQVAARLLVVVPGEASRPVSARRETYAQTVRMLQDKEVAARLLESGAVVVVLPQDVPLTRISSFNHLHHQAEEQSGRGFDSLRGATAGLTAAVPEENLLGEMTEVGPSPHQAEGYSTATHEIAHLLHLTALPGADRDLIKQVYDAKKTQEAAWRKAIEEGREPGPQVMWPDGVSQDLQGREAVNYSSRNEYEFFAQLSNAYLGTNHGTDKATGRPRNNGTEWVQAHEPRLLPLLRRLYGADPQAVHSTPANPVTATGADNAMYEFFRAFMDGIEGVPEPLANAEARSRTATASSGSSTDPDAITGVHAAPSGPARRITADAMEAYFRAYTDFFESDDAAADFNSGYYVFADSQSVLTDRLAMHESLANRMRAFHGELVRIRDEQATRPTVIAHAAGEPARLYRKMSAEEAAQILDARTPAAGITAAMAYNRSDEYRKFFTTSLSHTHVFSNANAASDSEVVVEFTLPWNSYWTFAGEFGTPNQQTGAYQIRDSALIHQERLRTGAGANFRSAQDVDTVVTERTHHNIGIGHGNARDFASLITARRQVPPAEVTQAAADAAEATRQARRPTIDALIQQQVAPLRQREAEAGAVTLHPAPLSAPEQTDQTSGIWSTPPSVFVRNYGSRHDGNVGLVHVEPLPAEVVAGLHDQVMTALGVPRPVADDHPLLVQLRDRLSAEELARELPYLRSSGGLSVTVVHEGRERTVDVRLALRDPVRSERYGANSVTDPEGRVERRAQGTQESSGTAASGTIRAIPVPWSGSFPIAAAGPVRAIDGALSLTLTHNQFSSSTTVTNVVQTMTAQRSNELSQPFEFSGEWEVRLDSPALAPSPESPLAAPGGWSRPRSHGPVTIWFPEHLAVDHEGELPEPAGLDDLPVWGVDSVQEPGRLLSEVRQSFGAELAALSESSAGELRTFLSEQVRRGTLPLQRGRGLYSPVLLDGDGNAIGMLQLTTVVEPVEPTHRSLDGKINLEAHVTQTVKVDSSAKLTSGVAFDGSVGPGFSGDHDRGHAGATSVVSGSFVGKAGVKLQTNSALAAGGSASMTHSMRSNRSHLLGPVRVTHRVTLIKARGGSTSHDFGPWDAGMHLRILSKADALGQEHAPGEGVRELPDDLENLRSLGMSAAPLAVTGTEQLFERAEVWLREGGFLPPTEPTAGKLFDEETVKAQLMNLRRFEQARSEVGLRASVDAMLDGGQALWFDRPTRTGSTRRVQLRLSAFRDTSPGPGTGTRHRRTLPDVQNMGISSFSIGGTESSGYAYGWQAGFGGGAAGPVGGDRPWSLGGSGDYTYARGTAHTSTVGAGINQDQFFIGSGQAAEVFEVPAQFALDLYEGPGAEPSVRFADPGRHPDDEVSAAAPTDIERPAEPERPVVRTVAGQLTLLVPHHRTVEPGQRRETPPGHSVRLADADDTARLAMTGPDGNPLPGVVRLPDDAIMDVVRGSAALLDAFGQAVTNTYPGHPERGLLDQAWDTVAAYVPGKVAAATAPARDWASEALVGSDVMDQSAPLTEALRTALSPANLVARAHQIFKGGYVIEGLTLPGLGADHEFSVELQGFLHDPEHLHSAKQYLETDVGATDTATQQVTASRSHGGAVAAMAQQRPVKVPAGAPKPEPSARFNPSGRYGFTHRTDDTHTLGSSTGVTRTPTESGTQHRVRSDATILMTIRHGRRNVIGNPLGLGTAEPVTVAVELPRAAQFLLTDPQLARDAAWLEGVEGLTVPERPEPTLPLPDRFARTGEPGLAGVLSVKQLGGGPDGRAERRDRLRSELTDLVEREAPGSTTPGRASYLPGVRARIADITMPTSLRALPGRGPQGVQRFHFRHVAKGGARLVEVTLRARPVQNTAGLRTVRGRPAGAGTGQEQVHIHAPANTSSAVSETRQHSGTVNPTTRYPRPADDTRTDRTGPALAVAGVRTDTAKVSASAEDRFWMRTDNAADFDVEYEYVASVRSELVTDWPLDVPGGLIEGGILAWHDSDATTGLAEWLKQTLHGRPARTATVPAEVTLRFTGSEAADPPESTTPVPAAVSAVHPSVAPPGADGRRLTDGQRLVPTGPTPVFHFNGYPQLDQALRTVAPRLASAWQSSEASSSAEASAVRIGELIQAGRISLDAPRAATGLTSTLPGTYPVESDPGTPPALRITLHNPRRITDAGDVTLDRLRLPTTAASTSLATGTTPAAGIQAAYDAGGDGRNIVGVGVALLAQQPITQGQGSANAATRREWFKTGGSALPADGRGVRSYETMTDVVITVDGPEGTRYVTGSAELRLPERDVLGYGITAARTDPQIYDLRSMLADESTADLRDWTTHPLTDLPAALADRLDPQDPAAQIWLAPDSDPDGSLLGRALYAASRTAVLADRPVELVLRTDDGLRHWRFAATGGLTSTDADTTDAWTDLAARITAHADAARAQADARRRESDLRGPQAESRGALATARADLDTATTEHTDARTALGIAETGLTDARTALTSARARRDHWESESRKLSAALLALPGRISEVRQRESAASGEVRAAGAFLEHIDRQEAGTVPETRAHEARERARKADERLVLVQGELSGLRADQVRVQGELNTARGNARTAADRLPGLEQTLADATSEAAGAKTRLDTAAENLTTATGDHDAVRDRLRSLNRDIVLALKDQSDLAAVQTDAEQRLPGLADTLGAARQASGEGLVSVPLSSLASTPARRPGPLPTPGPGTVEPTQSGTTPAPPVPPVKPPAPPTVTVTPPGQTTAPPPPPPPPPPSHVKSPGSSSSAAGPSSKASSGKPASGQTTAGGTLLPPAGGRPIRTVANGECLLHAFLASDPRHVRNSLPGLAGDHPESFRWLADAGGVRSDLRRRAEAYSHSGTLPRHRRADPVVAAMREFVTAYLVRVAGSGQLPHEVIGQLRLSTTREFSRGLRRTGTAQLVALARWHGIDDPAGLDSLSDDELRERLEFAYATSPAPLTPDELAGLLNAVRNWAQSWESAYGEVFPALTAHAFGVRIDVARVLAPGQRRVVSGLGPQDGAAAGNVEIFYNGVNHYDGSDAMAADGTGPHAAPAGPASQGEASAVGSDDWSDLVGLNLDPDAVSVVQAVRPPRSDALVAALLTLPAEELTQALEFLDPAHRRWLATHKPFVNEARTSLPAPEFAQVAARLLVVVPGEVLRPVSARHETYAQTARMLQDKQSTARLLESGAVVVVLPQDAPLTGISSFAHLHGEADEASGRRYDALRGATAGLTAAVPEENLLGEITTVGPSPHQAEGYSTATHEIAHLLHLAALTDTDRDLIKHVYDTKKDEEADRKKAVKEGRQPGPRVQWPDNVNPDLQGREAANYSSTNEYEFFAQLSNAYLGTNHGTDNTTGRPRNNGTEWVQAHEPQLLPLLRRLYGHDPQAVHSTPANPVTATGTDNAMYEFFRAFMAGIEGVEGEAVSAADAVTPSSKATLAAAGSGSVAGVHAAPSGPAKRITADVMEAYFRAYADFFESDDAAADFNSGYYVFADGQSVLDGRLTVHESLVGRMRAFHDGLVRIRDEQAGQPTVIPRTGAAPVRLYRKMSAEEAAQILDARSAAAGIAAAMAYNRSDEYRKFFTTSLSHTSVFSNANAASDTEVVVEFTLPWNSYWTFAERFGTPNQQTGAYQIRDSALIHQERLRTGAGANFRSAQDVDAVIADRTHHNIGIGHGNAREFASLVTAGRRVPDAEVAQAAANAAEDARQARGPGIDALIREKVAPLRQREAETIRATVHTAPPAVPATTPTGESRHGEPHTPASNTVPPQLDMGADSVSYGDEKPVAEANAGAQDSPDSPDAEDGQRQDGQEAQVVQEAQDARGFRRIGDHTAVLDGTRFTLHAASEADADTLLSVLRHAAPAALAESGVDTGSALRERLVRGVGDGEVPAVMVPQPTGGRSLSVPRLEELGVLLDNSQRTQGILLGGDLPLTDLTPVQRLHVLLGDPTYADAETRISALLAISAHLFGAKVVVVGSDGEVTLLGDPGEPTHPGEHSGSAPPALLVFDSDGGGHLVGRPVEPPKNERPHLTP